MKTLFIIPLVLLSLVSFPSWAVTFKDGEISSESEQSEVSDEAEEEIKKEEE